MNTPHIRSVPEDLDDQLQHWAKARNRSLSAQVISMLAKAIEDEECRKKQTQTLTSIQRRRFKAPRNAPSSLDLLGEDRAR